MIAEAHKMGLLTTPYAFNPDEAAEMAKASADIIVAHMGLTTSGSIGAKTALSVEESVIHVQAIADAAHRINSDVIVLCHGGTIWMPLLFTEFWWSIGLILKNCALHLGYLLLFNRIWLSNGQFEMCWHEMFTNIMDLLY